MSEMVFGVDVSAQQQNIDWQQIVAHNVKFAFIRAAFGAGEDLRIRSNWQTAKSAGLLRGAYLFYRPDFDASPTDQADAFVSALGGDLGELPLVVDVETNWREISPQQWVQVPPPPFEVLEPGVRQCLERVTQQSGRRPIIYTGAGYWNDHLSTASWAKDYDLWFAYWPNVWTPTTPPLMPNAWSTWRFWQYSANGNQQGAAYGVQSGDIDLDVFNGDLDALRTYAGGHSVVVQPGGGMTEHPVWIIATDGLNFRSQPVANPATLIAALPYNTQLNALGDTTTDAIGNQWQQVRMLDGRVGFVCAFLAAANMLTLSNTQPQVTQQLELAEPGQVRPGESPWIFGVHDPFDTSVIAGSTHTGWVLFTEEVGENPSTVAGRRGDYGAWSHRGYGVIARLNHGYGAAGTIPDPAQFDAFADACGAWVSKSIDPADPAQGCHIWIIGNEMNNHREWPGNDVAHGNQGREITPENYADCFNRVRARIKAVQPDAIVCIGAIDPYFSNSCKDFLGRMFLHIQDIDGVAVHAYTHGSDPNLITDTKKFDNDPLTWQYYHFLAYQTTLALVPDKFRSKPVFFTESDQVGAWADTNSGWVRKAYAEINRWNSQPDNVQQIRCLLLFSWSHKDDGLDFRISIKPGVLDDFRAAALNDYRWRAPVTEKVLFMGIEPRAKRRRAAPKVKLTVVKPGAVLRSRPVDGEILAKLRLRGRLTLCDTSDTSITMIGVSGEWVAVTDSKGRDGFVDAGSVQPAPRKQKKSTSSKGEK